MTTTSPDNVELKVIAGAGIGGPLRELAAQYENTRGRKVTIFFGTTPELIRKVTSGELFDLGIAPREVFNDEGARARFAAGPTVDIARVGLAVAVRSGAPKPDISTPEALKRALLNARSVATIPESAAGAQIMRLFDRFDIGAAMKPKIKPQPGPAEIGQAVLKGDAELAVFLVNVLTVPGLDVAGMFPPEVQQEVCYMAAVSAHAKKPDVANGFITFLTTPDAKAVIKAKGMEPAGR
jgi:molybdate transport system substrate-binding protein